LSKRNRPEQFELFFPGSVTSTPRSTATAAPRGNDRNLVIEASAGTGKTTEIVRLVLKVLIEEPDLSPERIALITFTEKAAAEIAVRIESALVELHESLDTDHPGWPLSAPPDRKILAVPPEKIDAVRAAAKKQMARLDRLRSQTIHSFCQSILTIHTLEAGLSPRFSVIQGFEQSRVYGEIYAQWLESETVTSESTDHQRDWETIFESLRSVRRIEETIMALLPRRELLADSSYELGDLREGESEIRRAVAYLQDLAPRELEAIGDEPAREMIHYLKAHPFPQETDVAIWKAWFKPIAPVLETINLNNLRKNAAVKDVVKVLRGENAYRDNIFVLLRTHLMAIALRRLAGRFFLWLDREKKRRGILDFDDLLLETLQVLKQRDVLRDTRSRFDYIFVDEFQDTDWVQSKIIEQLARDDQGEFVPGKLIIVGDPKQSIYSFRRADPENYEATLRTFLGGGAEHRELLDQYRSDPALVEDFNAMFRELFREPSTRNVARPVYASDLVARRQEITTMETRINFLLAPPKDAGDHHAAQARAIVSWIRQEGGDDLRRFAVLFRKRTHLHEYLEVFDRSGIPYQMPPSRYFLERPAVVDLMTVLRAIAYRFDRGSLIFAARSPYFALSDEEIADAILRGDESRSTTWKEFLSTIDRYVALARHYPVARMIDQLVRDTRIDTFYSALKGGARSIAHLEHLRDLALDYDLSVGGSLRQFVDEIDRRREEADEPEPNLLDPHADAIQVMTVHSAKGLEFDRVILPDLAGRLHFDPIRMHAIEDPRTLVFTGSAEPLAARFREADGMSLHDVCKERATTETDRLFYVAVTRARTDVAFVCNPEKLEETGFWSSLRRTFTLDRKLLAREFPDEPGVKKRAFVLSEGTVIARFHRFEEVEMNADQHARFIDETVAALGSGESFSIEPPADIEKLPVAAARRKLAGSRRRSGGIILHRILERWDGTLQSLDGLLDALSVEQRFERSDPELRKRLEKLAASPLMQRIRSAETVGRELPIYFLDSSGAPRAGRIDRLLRENRSWLVVDYKTGPAYEARLEEDRIQVQRYCEAMKTMTSAPVTGILWYIGPESDEAVEVGAE